MDLIAIKEGTCTGCTACLYACPNACIDMVEDREGFLYPEIDQEVCFNCNACNTTCPAIKTSKTQTTLGVYAAYNADDDVRLKSTSGGAFTVLAKDVFEKNGVVYGVAFDNDWMAHHVRIDKEAELDRLRGSKYIQSAMGDIFAQVQEDLETGRMVLFSGTPCQVDGLKAMLVKDYEHLVTCAVVCHGVPSPGVFQKYVTSLNKKLGNNIKDIAFRKRNPTWRQYALVFESTGQRYISPAARDPYFKGFVEGLYERPSCHQCPSKPNSADIVIGDYWGVEHFHKGMDDAMGTSLIITQTPRGQVAFDNIRDQLILEESTFDSAIAYNPAIVKSGKSSPKRASFFNDYQTKDFNWLSKKYLRETKAQYLTRVAKHIVKKCLGYLKPTKEN